MRPPLFPKMYVAPAAEARREEREDPAGLLASCGYPAETLHREPWSTKAFTCPDPETKRDVMQGLRRRRHRNLKRQAK